MNRTPVILSVAVAFAGTVFAAEAGPCTKQISQLEAQIQRAQAQRRARRALRNRSPPSFTVSPPCSPLRLR